MLLLALPQIYTRVFYLRKSFDLDSAWVRDFRPYQISFVSSRAFSDAPPSSFRRGDLNQCLLNFLRMLVLALAQIYTRVFHLWKSFDLDSAQVRDSRPYQITSRRFRAFRDASHSRFRCGDLKQCLLNFLKILLLALLLLLALSTLTF